MQALFALLTYLVAFYFRWLAFMHHDQSTRSNERIIYIYIKASMGRRCRSMGCGAIGTIGTGLQSAYSVLTLFRLGCYDLYRLAPLLLLTTRLLLISIVSTIYISITLILSRLCHSSYVAQPPLSATEVGPQHRVDESAVSQEPASIAYRTGSYHREVGLKIINKK
jgi:hypothetical protein